MKALIIYDSLTFALRANCFLRNAAHGANTKIDWDVNFWRANVLKFESVAREALKGALDTDLIVFAGPRSPSLPGWLEKWLEDWAARRQVQDAALAVIEDQDATARPELMAAELCVFARRHGLGFIASQDVRKVEPTPLPRGQFSHSRDVRSHDECRGHSPSAPRLNDAGRSRTHSPSADFENLSV